MLWKGEKKDHVKHNTIYCSYSCSVPCFKEHKQNPCSAPPEPKRETNDMQQSEIEYEFPTEDTVPIETLNLLGKCISYSKNYLLVTSHVLYMAVWSKLQACTVITMLLRCIEDGG